MNAPRELHLGELRFADFTQPMEASKRRDLIARLRQILPADSVLDSDESLKAYECDGLAGYTQLPSVVVLPTEEHQVIAILKLAHDSDIPVVARGAGTGLSGGATPHRGGVILSLARFKKILSIDPKKRTACIQPGVRNLAISEAAAPFNLYYAPDPSSQIACSIGGNVAENSGGVHCLKYGLTVHNVLRVRGITIEGDVLELGSEAPDAPGLDLLSLVVGSEGMLAVVTEVTVKLVPKPTKGGRCRGGLNRQRHYSGGLRDDGPEDLAGGRRVRACGIRPGCTGNPIVRVRWHARRS